MRKFFKYLGITISAIILLLFLVLFLLYLPGVQNFLKDKAVSYVSSNYGLTVRAGSFRLGFPLDLTLEDVYAGSSESDTLAAVGTLHLNVGIREIFRQRLRLDELALKEVKFRLSNDTSGMLLRVAVQELMLREGQVYLGQKRIEVKHLSLAEGEVSLVTPKDSVPDTTASTPFPWTFLVNKIELQRVGYRMNTATLPFLGAGVEQATLVNSMVGVGVQLVVVDSVDISGGWCNMQTAAVPAQQELPGKQDSVAALPWTVTAGVVRLDNSAFSLTNGGTPAAELVLSGIGVQIDSVYNRGTIVRAQLKDLKTVQKDGLAITAMQANVALDSADTRLQGGYIRTPFSWIRLEAHTETDVQHLLKEVPLSAHITGEIGMADILPFYPELPRSLRDKKVGVNTSFSLTTNRVQVGQLILDMPRHFKITGSGSLSSFQDFKQMRGNFVLRGILPDVTFAQVFLKDSGIQIPRNMDMLARLGANRGKLESLLRLCCDQGCLSLDAAYGWKAEAYDAELALNGFPLDRFLPADSLGNVTAAVRLSGSAFRWNAAQADINAEIMQLQYRRHNYKDIKLEASLNKTRVRGTLTSQDPDIPLELILQGDSLEGKYVASLGGRIGKVDVEALHFVQEPFTAGANLDIQATMGAKETYTLRMKLDSVKMSDAKQEYALGVLAMDMDSDQEETKLELNSGDLNLHFQTDTSLMGFVNNIGKVAEVVRGQVEKRNVDMEQVRETLPPFSLQIKGAQKNVVSRFLNVRNIGFKNLLVDITSRKRSGIRVGVMAKAPYLGTVRLDSVQLGAWQTGKSLMYSLAAGSSAEDWKGLFNINMMGRMEGDRFRLELKQKDVQNRIGFDLGVNTVIGDSAVTVSFFPMNPILGYSRWIVNADNRVVIGQHGKIRANLRMAYMNKLVSIQSLEDQGEKHDRLKVEVSGIDLAALSRMVPFMPELGGSLNTDVLLYSRDNEMGADGYVRVAKLEYNKQYVGTLDLGLQYVVGNRFTDHAVEFELKVDSVRRAIAKGTFSTSETNRELKVDMDLPSLPLYMVNAFIPADLMKLDGELSGNLRLRGTTDDPLLNGGLAFRNGKADVIMLGTTFRLDTIRVPVEDGKILFRKYRFIAPNNSNLVLNGNIALTPFDRMNMDIAVDADNFEVVNVKKNEVSLLYGKAYADIHSRIAGRFDNLAVTGNVNLLNRTNITYTLRSSGPALVDKSIDLVRFVSFRDTTLNEKDYLTNRINSGSFAMRMLIEIGDQVKVGVDLSEDGSNHVNIQGGGNLVLAMNPESGMTLSGKYILSGGTVEYNVPIVGKKEFSIQSGSFVEWTGNVMNPMMNISAAEQVKANVDDGDQTRQVVFDAIIRIQNTLNRPDITFDLSAPSDMVIQNQLATFSPEERTRQALNLLIYNTYTAPGAAKSSSGGNVANNAIYGFVENELNKYTRKAGLTVGFDSHNTDDNTTRTDVTYQFSRQLFNDRVRVKIGGRISTDGNEGQSNTLQDNLVDDISIEYVLTKKRNLYVKVFRHSNYESVLDGEVTQTGVGIVWRKTFRKLKDLFGKR